MSDGSLVNINGNLGSNKPPVEMPSSAAMIRIIYGVQPSGDLTILDGVQAAGPRFFAGYDHAGRLLGVVIESSERGYADTILAMFPYSI